MKLALASVALDVAAMTAVLPSPRLRWGGVGGGGSMRDKASRRKDTRVPHARRLRRYATDAERKLWRGLRELASKRAHFRRQATIGPYFADFACHTSRLVIELDGGHHGDGVQANRDAERDAFLRNNGYRVLRFWNNDVMQNMDGVLSVISEAIQRASPPTPDPSPPLRGGRGIRRPDPSPQEPAPGRAQARPGWGVK